MSILETPWPWYIAGPLIGLVVPLLLILGNKSFGISSNLRHICAAIIPTKLEFFTYDWKKQSWNLFFAAGIVLGGFIGNFLLNDPQPIAIANKTLAELKLQGIRSYDGLLPLDIFSWEALFTLRGFVFIVVGGFLVGFGTRYAGGCTSGHSIMGLANFQWPSLVATIAFMIGGIITTHLFLPYLLAL